MKTIAFCISIIIRYYISTVMRQRVEYKFLIKMCVYICIMKKKNIGTQYSLSKVLEQLKIPSYIMGK